MTHERGDDLTLVVGAERERQLLEARAEHVGAPLFGLLGLIWLLELGHGTSPRLVTSA